MWVLAKRDVVQPSWIYSAENNIFRNDTNGIEMFEKFVKLWKET